MVRHNRGVPVFAYRTDPGTPPVSVLRLDKHSPDDTNHPHIHDFPLLAYVGEDNAAYVVAPGQTIDTSAIRTPSSSITVFFDPAALAGGEHSPWSTWHAHPLLSPFLHGRPDGVLRVDLPAEHSAQWERTIIAIETETTARQDGYRQAALAYLTLLLIDLARLTADVVGELRNRGEPLLATVFEVIDRQHTEALSLRDVANIVGITPGHLTTVVRRRTGRTVQEWIIERRMQTARQLLASTDLPIGEIAHGVGMSDPGYFTRVFRNNHETSPREWRKKWQADSKIE